MVLLTFFYLHMTYFRKWRSGEGIHFGRDTGTNYEDKVQEVSEWNLRWVLEEQVKKMDREL